MRNMDDQPWLDGAQHAFVELRNAFWQGKCDKSMIQDFLALFTFKCTLEQISRVFSAETTRIASDWILLSFLFYELKENHKNLLNSTGIRRLMNVILKEPNVVLSFKTCGNVTVPGTRNVKSSMKILTSTSLRIDNLYEFGLAANEGALCFYNPEAVVDLLKSTLAFKTFSRIHMKIKQVVQENNLVMESIRNVNSQHPSKFFGKLFRTVSSIMTDFSDLTLANHLAECVSDRDLRNPSLNWTHNYSAACLRVQMSTITRKLDIPEEASSLYRMFPFLVALLVAIEDVEMIESIAEKLKIPVGPSQWNEDDFNFDSMSLLAKHKVILFKSPIICAGQYKNKKLIEILSRSCMLSEEQTALIQSSADEQASIKSQYLESEFLKLRKDFWSNDWSDQMINRFIRKIPLDYSSDDILAVLSGGDVSKMSDWIFFCCLFHYIKQDHMETMFVVVPNFVDALFVLILISFERSNAHGTLNTQEYMNNLTDSANFITNMQRFVLHLGSKQDSVSVYDSFVLEEYQTFLRQPSLEKNLISFVDNQTQVRNLISSTNQLGAVISRIASAHPSRACDYWFNADSGTNLEIIDEETLVKNLVLTFPYTDLRQDLGRSFQAYLVACVRNCMQNLKKQLYIPPGGRCLYRIFPNLMALLVAIEDTDLIDYLSDRLKLPIGPMNWYPWDMSKEIIELHTGHRNNVLFFKSPIVSAAQSKHTRITQLLSISCRLTDEQMIQLQSSTDQQMSTISELKQQNALFVLWNSFWIHYLSVSMIFKFIDNLPTNYTLKDVSRAFHKEIIPIESGWIFFSFLLSKLTHHLESRIDVHSVLREFLLSQPQIIATFDVIEEKHIPGTLNSKSSMMVVSGCNILNSISSHLTRTSEYEAKTVSESFNFVQKYFLNIKAFRLLHPSDVAEFARNILSRFPFQENQEEVKSFVLKTTQIKSNLEKIRESNPLEFIRNLVEQPNIDELSLMKRLTSGLPAIDLCSTSSEPFRYFFASILRHCLSSLDTRECLSEHQGKSKSPRKLSALGFMKNSPTYNKDPECLYRTFPQFIALLVAVEDVAMIQCLSNELNLPVGPLTWFSKEMNLQKNSFNGVIFFKYAIVSAIRGRNQKLIDILCQSCQITTKQMMKIRGN